MLKKYDTLRTKKENTGFGKDFFSVTNRGFTVILDDFSKGKALQTSKPRIGETVRIEFQDEHGASVWKTGKVIRIL